MKHFLGLQQLAHMLDLHLFLGRPLKLTGKDSRAQDDGLVGSVTQLLVDEEENFLKRAHDQSHDLVSKIGLFHERALVDNQRGAANLELLVTALLGNLPLGWGLMIISSILWTKRFLGNKIEKNPIGPSKFKIIL